MPELGEVAQLVEHTTENRGVAGSIPALATRGCGASSGCVLGRSRAARVAPCVLARRAPRSAEWRGLRPRLSPVRHRATQAQPRGAAVRVVRAARSSRPATRRTSRRSPPPRTSARAVSRAKRRSRQQLRRTHGAREDVQEGRAELPVAVGRRGRARPRWGSSPPPGRRGSSTGRSRGIPGRGGAPTRRSARSSARASSRTGAAASPRSRPKRSASRMPCAVTGSLKWPASPGSAQPGPEERRK